MAPLILDKFDKVTYEEYRKLQKPNMSKRSYHDEYKLKKRFVKSEVEMMCTNPRYNSHPFDEFMKKEEKDKEKK